MKLSIPNQCSESFDSFTSTSAGGFCQSCQKEVVDFRDMTDAEVLSYFTQNRGKTCGSFRPAQLKTYKVQPQQHNHRFTRMLSAGALSFSLFTFLPIIKGQAQTQDPIMVSPVQEEEDVPNQKETGQRSYSMEGTVIDEDGEPLVGVVVLMPGVESGIFTDEDGKFTFPDLQPGNTLVFSYIGYESQAFIVPPANLQNGNRIRLRQTIRMSCPVIMGDVSVDGLYESKPSIWQRIGRAFR